MLTLLPIEIGPQHLDHPLPYDLYNRQGVLLARCGTHIQDHARLAHLAGQRLYRPGDPSDASRLSPLASLHSFARKYSETITDIPRLDVDALSALALELRQLVLEHPEVCIGMGQRLPLPSLAQRHALFVAIMAVVMARHAGMEAAQQVNLTRAALTMNLPSLSLQDQLSASVGRPDASQHEVLFHHPQRACALLVAAGVTDSTWLELVAQHHENVDGSGYPLGLKGQQIGPEARILRAADVWCALFSHRHNRLARYPMQAFQEGYIRERGRLDDAALLSLRHLLGPFPPGTLVRLANRETALITRWFGNRHSPGFAISLLRPDGRPTTRPQRRSTGATGYAIRGYTYLPLHHDPVDWERAWALA
ncbi:MAG: HD domain-containing phosphohydrolase [Pseudomonadota bacterium]|nr:HD domain-containing phosphohydrolase [Pseudomonadota bacterium]